MDISTVKPNESILDIVHPGKGGEQLGIRVGVRSLHDDALKKIKRRIQDESLNLQKRGKVFSSEQIDTNRNALVFAAMTFWLWEKPLLEPERVEGDKTIPAVYGDEPTFHGEKPTFNQAMVFKVFDELPWFRDQIEERVDDTKVFFQ